MVASRPAGDRIEHLRARLQDGLEDGLTLVIAKSVLGLLDAGVDPAEIVRAGIDFGTTYRDAGWGAGLTVLVAMANLLPDLGEDDRPLALVHGLAFVSRDTRNRPPRFRDRPAAGTTDIPPERLAGWYRRFVETRSSDAAERVLATALATAPGDGASHDGRADDVRRGHRPRLHRRRPHARLHQQGVRGARPRRGGWPRPRCCPPSSARRRLPADQEETASWRHPHDLAGLVRRTVERARRRDRGRSAQRRAGSTTSVGSAGGLLADDPEAVVGSLLDALTSGADPGAARTWPRLRRGAAHRAVPRAERLRRLGHRPPRLHRGERPAPGADAQPVGRAAAGRRPRRAPRLPRPVPQRARRQPSRGRRLRTSPTCARAGRCRARSTEPAPSPTGTCGAAAIPGSCSPHLGAALLAEDAEFHWFQVLEAGARQFHAWPTGSEEGALVLAGVARFLAAHTPTRRELPQVVQIATRLGRGETLYEDPGDQVADRTESSASNVALS